MADLRIGTATSAPAAGTLKLGSTDISKIYSGSTLVWPISSSADPFNPINGTATFIHADNGVITLYDTSWNTVSPSNPFATTPNSNYTVAASSQGYTKIILSGLVGREAVLYSINNGQNFSAPSSGSFDAVWGGIFGSISGDTILAIQSVLNQPVNALLISTDAGENFNASSYYTLPSHPNTPSYSSSGNFTNEFKSSAISSGGKYIAFCARGTDSSGSYRDYSFWSNDYGITFNNFNYNGIYIDEVLPIISGNGRIICAMNTNNMANSLYSDDYGATWTTKDYSNIGAQNPFTARACMSENGQYYMFSQTNSNTSPSGTCIVVYGNNYAVSFDTTTPKYLTNSFCPQTVFMVSNGQFQGYIDEGSTSPTYELSTDFGSTWSSTPSAGSIGQGPTFLIDV
jgi:hypothetical protein